jgi:hypothetical protein
MSRRPGIGKGWFDKYKNDVYPEDKCVVRKDLICHPPKYYDMLYDLTNPTDFAKIKYKRLHSVNKEDNTPDRLRVKEVVKWSKLQKLVRNIE